MIGTGCPWMTLGTSTPAKSSQCPTISYSNGCQTLSGEDMVVGVITGASGVQHLVWMPHIESTFWTTAAALELRLYSSLLQGIDLPYLTSPLTDFKPQPVS